MSQTIDDVRQEAMSCYEKRGKEFVETFNRMSNQTIIIASWKELARIVSPREPIRRKSTSPAASGRREVNPSPEPGVLRTPPEPLQHHPSQPENRMSASTDASSTPNPGALQRRPAPLPKSLEAAGGSAALSAQTPRTRSGSGRG